MSSLTDIDECTEKPGTCTQFCENQPGSYLCKCADGYEKAPDGQTCKRMDGESYWHLDRCLLSSTMCFSIQHIAIHLTLQPATFYHVSLNHVVCGSQPEIHGWQPATFYHVSLNHVVCGS